MPTKRTARKKGWSRPNRGWKETQAKKQINKKTKYALIAIILILGLIIFGRGVRFITAIFTPWQSANTSRTYFWQGDFNINLLIKAKNISLLSYSPQNQQITVLEIPQNSYVEVAKGFGKWELRSVFDLGGDKLLKDTLANLLGIPIDGYLRLTDKYSSVETTTLLEQFRKDPFILISLLPYLKTDLTPFELIRLKMGMAGVRFDKIKQTDLEQTNSFQNEQLADGTQILTPDQVKLDAQISQLAEVNFQSEHKTIAIFNSTTYLGLAQKAARIVTNLGGDVIITSNSQNKFVTSVVYGEKSKTLDRLKQIFGSNGTIDPKLEDLVLSRAQINIFLGEDYFNR